MEPAEHVSEFDAPWTFAVTWDPERGLPRPILRLFQHRSDVEPGRAAHHTDRGHGTYYVKAVEKYVSQYHPERTDIQASATKD